MLICIANAHTRVNHHLHPKWLTRICRLARGVTHRPFRPASEMKQWTICVGSEWRTSDCQADATQNNAAQRKNAIRGGSIDIDSMLGRQKRPGAWRVSWTNSGAPLKLCRVRVSPLIECQSLETSDLPKSRKVDRLCEVGVIRGRLVVVAAVAVVVTVQQACEACFRFSATAASMKNVPPSHDTCLSRHHSLGR